MLRNTTELVVAFVLVGLVGCGHERPPTPAAPKEGKPDTLLGASPGLAMSADLSRQCNVAVAGPFERPPLFEFDSSELEPQDRLVLQQVATCLTTGPLKGRRLRLVGRTDPQGEPEYNMSLGERRAGTAQSYLTKLGVDPLKLTHTSRGELDASGHDESTWRRDRRVDLLLE